MPRLERHELNEMAERYGNAKPAHTDEEWYDLFKAGLSCPRAVIEGIDPGVFAILVNGFNGAIERAYRIGLKQGLEKSELAKAINGLREVVEKNAPKDVSVHSCEESIEKVRGKGWLTSGLRQDGERVTCSCEREYIHICDEAEGCFWDSPANSGTPKAN